MRAPWLLPCLALNLAAQAPLDLQAPIRRVRLHPDEAWVTRIGTVKVAGSGVHRLAIRNLPAGLVMEDVRVAARGPEGSRLGDLTLGAEPRKVTETAEYKALKAEWEALGDRQDVLEAEGQALDKEKDFLHGLQAAYDKEISARLAGAVPTAASVVDLSRGIEGRLAEVLIRDRRRRRELEKVEEDFKRVNEELNKRAAERSESPSQALVEVATSGPGEVEVEFTYRQHGARWEPGYEARLSADGKKVDLAIFATVRQDTGEDWKGVALEITNARASRSLAMARYAEAKVIDGRENQPVIRGGSAKEVNFYLNAQQPSPGIAQNTMIAAPPEPPKPTAPAALAEAVPLEEAQGLASTWALEGAKDIPADREPHRFRMLSRDAEPTLALVATPRLDPTVYRVARFAVPTGIPLFPGSPVVHYAGTQRVGQAALELPQTGAPFQFGFGPYRGVRVELRRVDAVKESVGTFTKETQWTLKERMEVANDTAETVVVELQDRELKPASDKVKVTALPDATPSREGAVPGVRAWTLTVEPRGKAAVVLGSQIRIPAAWVLWGADDLHLPR